MPTTEIFQCQLKAGSNIGDAQNEAAKVVKAIGDKLKMTPGVQQIQFGMQVEKPDFFQLFVSKFRFFLFSFFLFFLILSPQTIAASQPPTYILSYSQLTSVFSLSQPLRCGNAYIPNKQPRRQPPKAQIAGPDKVPFYLFLFPLNLYFFPQPERNKLPSSAILTIIIIITAWDNITAHQTFMKTEEYQPFLAHVLSVVSGPAGMLHVDFEPSNTFTKATTSAPVTEVATFYFDPSSSATTSPEANVLKFRDVVNAAGKEIDGFWGAAAGVSHETDVKSLSTEGVSGTAVVLVLGWESVEKHMAFRYVFFFYLFFLLSPNSPDTD